MASISTGFFKLIQPVIVKTSDVDELPEHLRNRYFLTFNVLGIQYFEESYMLGETDDGFTFLILQDNGEPLLLDTGSSIAPNILDVPRVYINITDKFISDKVDFRKFFFAAIQDNAVYGTGTESFVIGEDYWINNTLYSYLLHSKSISENDNIHLPNYIDECEHITKYFVDLAGTIGENYTNLDYFKKKNEQLDNKYSEEELRDFYANFCRIILNDTLISDDKRLEGNNAIYNIVLNYFANYKTDETSNSLNVVLNNFYSSLSSNQSSCSCNSVFSYLTSQNNTDIYTKTCSTLYTEAMDLYLEQMLGDIEFYKDWFTIELSEYDCEINDLLIENLVEFIHEFLDCEFSLNFDTSTEVHSTWTCGSKLTDDSSSKNYKTIEKYLNVLNFVNDNQLVQNTNKIKIWGNNFGKLLPYLQF